MKHSIIYAGMVGLFACISFQSCQKETTATTTYANDIATIVTNNCTSCHSGTAPQGGLSLTTYANVKDATENGTLLQRINDAANPMPQGGLMSASDREKFQIWANEGYGQ